MTRQAFEHIAHELRPRLKDIGRRFFGDEDRAEDIAQETLNTNKTTEEQP
jgi:DNA-directed RNA polymerase specialized sigma24 family protein